MYGSLPAYDITSTLRHNYTYICYIQLTRVVNEVSVGMGMDTTSEDISSLSTVPEVVVI